MTNLFGNKLSRTLNLNLCSTFFFLNFTVYLLFSVSCPRDSENFQALSHLGFESQSLLYRISHGVNEHITNFTLREMKQAVDDHWSSFLVVLVSSICLQSLSLSSETQSAIPISFRGVSDLTRIKCVPSTGYSIIIILLCFIL